MECCYVVTCLQDISSDLMFRAFTSPKTQSRTAPNATTLCPCQQCINPFLMGKAHHAPSKKMPLTAIFRRVGMCSPQTIGTGRDRIIMSVSKSVIA